MEPESKKHKKRKDRKPLYILVTVILLFSVFVFFITRPSAQVLAIRELDICFGKKDVEMVWYKYKSQLHENEEFLFETRKKLAGFNLTESELAECRSWLPPPPSSLNVIVIPDLSRRIIDSLNNPNQIANDLFVTKAIWQSFVEASKLRQDTKDRLIVDVTDIDQAKGQFSEIADSLNFDLSTHKGKSNRLYFTSEKEQRFIRSVSALYESAKQKPLGADYCLYLRRYLPNHLKKSTLFDRYVNKVIIITDGYLEAENKPPFTKIASHRSMLEAGVSRGEVLDVITSNRLNIPSVNVDLTGIEFMICEVNERKSGKGYDFEILKAYWTDWLTRMKAPKIQFLQREQANGLTKDEISHFVIR
jgi:hypothetical protein